MDLLYFILLVSILIFIHELGHFAVAKLFGVKVLTFCIGFGPKLIRLRGKDTEYALALFPLGGFVKMLEEAQGVEPILEEERKRTFEAQATWKRVAIVLAGPAMNILFPVFLYTAVFLEDRAFLPATVGVVIPGKPADGKLLPGDRIVDIDGVGVSSFPEVQRIVAKSAGRSLRFGVDRGGKRVDVSLIPADEIEPRELDIVEHVGRVGIVPNFPAGVIGVPRTDSPAYRAGLRTFDRITQINGRPIGRQLELETLLARNRGENLVISFLRPVEAPHALGGLCDLAVLEPGIATLTPLSRPADANVGFDDPEARARDVLARTGIESSEMYVVFVPDGSSEWQAGLRSGDRLTTLDGAPQRLWQVMEDELVRGASRVRAVGWTRAGEPMAGTFQLRKEQWDDELGQHYERYVFRTTHWLPNAPDAYVPNPNRYLYALRRGLEETASVLKFILVGFVRVVQGRVSLSSVSGPITIYDIAGQAGAKGTAYFVWAMALVSANLGLINLLPIPVLDGGHLAFLAIEGVARRPVPLRVREIASLIGMTLLALLLLLAFRNDIARHWESIVRALRELVGRG